MCTTWGKTINVIARLQIVYIFKLSRASLPSSVSGHAASIQKTKTVKMTFLVQTDANATHATQLEAPLGIGSMLCGMVGHFCNAELAAQPLRQFLKQKSLTSS